MTLFGQQFRPPQQWRNLGPQQRAIAAVDVKIQAMPILVGDERRFEQYVGEATACQLGGAADHRAAGRHLAMQAQVRVGVCCEIAHG